MRFPTPWPSPPTPTTTLVPGTVYLGDIMRIGGIEVPATAPRVQISAMRTQAVGAPMDLDSNVTAFIAMLNACAYWRYLDTWSDGGNCRAILFAPAVGQELADILRFILLIGGTGGSLPAAGAIYAAGGHTNTTRATWLGEAILLGADQGSYLTFGGGAGQVGDPSLAPNPFGTSWYSGLTKIGQSVLDTGIDAYHLIDASDGLLALACRVGTAALLSLSGAAALGLSDSGGDADLGKGRILTLISMGTAGGLSWSATSGSWLFSPATATGNVSAARDPATGLMATCGRGPYVTGTITAASFITAMGLLAAQETAISINGTFAGKLRQICVCNDGTLGAPVQDDSGVNVGFSMTPSTTVAGDSFAVLDYSNL